MRGDGQTKRWEEKPVKSHRISPIRSTGKPADDYTARQTGETGRQGDRETGRQGDRETGRQGDTGGVCVERSSSFGK
jgi:hypothetical protein